MQPAVIISALRTPLGSFGGGLRNIAAPTLAGAVTAALIERSAVPPEDVDEVIMGNVLGAGVGQNPARQAAAIARIPFSSSALTVNMVCGSGLRAVCLAASAINAGENRVIVAGGMENMSLAPFLMTREHRGRKPLHHMKYDGLRCAIEGEAMGIIAESLARSRGVSRREQDEYSFESHRRACASISKGVFQNEIVAVRPDAGGRPLDRDECPRADCTLEKLSSLQPAFDRSGTITAGNSTPIADGAAAVLVTSEQYARERALKPLARIVARCAVGVEPRETFAALAPAAARALSEARLSAKDVDIFEVGDSFAVEGIAFIRDLGVSPDTVNRRGGTLAFGHPLGASGARILVTLIHTVIDEQKSVGLAAICLGGGNAVAMLVEAV